MKKTKTKGAGKKKKRKGKLFNFLLGRHLVLLKCYFMA